MVKVWKRRQVKENRKADPMSIDETSLFTGALCPDSVLSREEALCLVVCVGGTMLVASKFSDK